MFETLPLEWMRALGDQAETALSPQLAAFLERESRAQKTILPPANERYTAFHLTPPEQVKVVILGQDPYHGRGQSHGLAFSVPHGVKIPPSLRNIFKELCGDIGAPPPLTGNLAHWAQQGVLLLNTVLSVEEGCAGSHAGKGWEEFTDAIISAIAARPSPCVFVLWGKYAQAKTDLIRKGPGPQLILASVHPSPLSAHRGFFGTRPFSRINSFLTDHGIAPIDW